MKVTVVTSYPNARYFEELKLELLEKVGNHKLTVIFFMKP